MFFSREKEALKECVKREFMPFCCITAGTLLLCLSIAALVEPYRFASAGVTGLALIPSYLWGLPPVWILTAGNVLLLIWGWKALSPRFALWTVYNTVLTSLALPLLETVRYPLMSDPILAALFGGVGRNTMRKSFAKAYGVSGYRQMFQASIDRLRKLEGIDITLANHTAQGPFMTNRRMNRGFVHPEQWQEFLDYCQAKLDELRRDDPEE